MTNQPSFIVTDRERALIELIRRMHTGTIERIGVQNGQPAVVVAVHQRIDLQKTSEVDGVLSGAIELLETAE